MLLISVANEDLSPETPQLRIFCVKQRGLTQMLLPTQTLKSQLVNLLSKIISVHPYVIS